jgi:hypothetical protein
VDTQREHHQVGLAGASADGGRAARDLLRPRVITSQQLPQRDREQQVAALGALLLVLQQPVGPGQPPTCLGELAPVDQVEGQPECAPRGLPELAGLGMELLGALQRPQAVLDPAEEVGRGRQQLQVLPGQGRRPVGKRQRGVGVRPRQPPGGLAAPRQLPVATHRAPTSTGRGPPIP